MKKPKGVYKVDAKTGAVVKTYESVKVAAYWNGVTPSAIYRAIKGKGLCVGHTWEYEIDTSWMKDADFNKQFIINK